MKRIVLLAAVTSFALSAFGAQPTSKSAQSLRGWTPMGPERPPTLLVTDVSGSTRALRGPGGQYEKDWMTAACYTAMRQGTLWATTANSATLKTSQWQVSGKSFAPTIEDNDLLGAAELRKQAQSLAPDARQIVG